MAKNLYLRCVGGRWDWRRRVPDSLVARFGRRELIKTIGSVPHAEAKERARHLTSVSDRLFRMIARKPELTADQIAELTQDYFVRRVASQGQWRAQRKIEDLDTLEEDQRVANQRADGAKELIRLGDIDAATEIALELLADNGVAVSPENPAFDDLRHAVLRANSEAARIHAARLSGDFAVAPVDPLFADALKAEKKPGKTVPTFGEAFQRYATEKASTGAWKADMRRENANLTALFVELAGDKRLDRYARSDISDFVGKIQGLPALRGKSPRFTGKPLADLIAMTEADPTIARLSPKSLKKHSSNLSSFFGWAVDQGFIGQNPAKGVFKMPKRTVRRSEERDAWSPEQLRILFASPLYRGAKSAFYRSEPGDVVIRDARFWLPLLGAFHPVRLEEVAQLRLDDVKEEGGIAFLDIHDGAEKGEDVARKVKSLAAVRRIPVHRILIELGFLDMVEELRRKGERMLFGELVAGGVAQRFGFGFTKWFGNYRKTLGLEAVDFHSFRHSAITALQRAHTTGDLIDQLDGHQAPGERARYGKGFGLPALKAAIDSIAYEGIDAAFIRAKR